MDAIDNRITSSQSAGALNQEDLANTSAAAKQDLNAQIAEKEIQELQQEQFQHRVQDTHLPVADTDPATEWDPWRIMVIRHQ